METLSNTISNTIKNQTELPKCPFCGKSYIWFIKEINFGNTKKTLKVPVKDCNCDELREQEAKIKRQEQYKANKLEALFDNSMMTPLFKEKTFNNLNPTQELNKCKEYVKEFNPRISKGIQMIGKIGTGKTTLLAAICNELLKEGYKCLFTTFSDLLDKFSEYSYQNAGNIKSLLNWLTEFDFIVLDDIGREAYTDIRKELAFRIIDTILNYKVVVAFTANPEMLLKLKKINELDAMIDRLKEICPIKFVFNGESLRGKA